MRQPISRRHILKGMGAAISLPFLEAMLPSMANAQTSPNKKYLAINFPNGTHPEEWYKGNTLNGVIMQPLAPYKNYVSVLRNVQNLPMSASTTGGHEGAATCFLTAATCPPQNGGVGFAASPRLYYASGGPQMSIDQVIGDSIGAQFRRKALVIAPLVDRVIIQPGCHEDNARNISWRGNTPVTAFASISALFNDIFGGGVPSTDPAVQARNQQKKSILDYVKEASSSLQKRLGREDTRRMASYFESIREVEVKMQSGGGVSNCSTEGAPQNVADPDRLGVGFSEWTKANLDLLVLAFQCGHTKVASYMLASEGSLMTQFQFVNSQHVYPIHSYSHYEPQTTNALERWNELNAWFVGRLAYIMQKMISINEGGPNMLDNTMILFGSGMSESHSPYDLPIIVAGKGGGTLNPAGTVRNMNGTSLAAIHLTMAQKMGVNISGFGKELIDSPSPNQQTVQL